MMGFSYGDSLGRKISNVVPLCGSVSTMIWPRLRRQDRRPRVESERSDGARSLVLFDGSKSLFF